MNHKWGEDDKCIHCGVWREKQTQKTRMAITNHPPYDHYVYERKYAYSFDLKKWTFQRPDCRDPQII